MEALWRCVEVHDDKHNKVSEDKVNEGDHEVNEGDHEVNEGDHEVNEDNQVDHVFFDYCYLKPCDDQEFLKYSDSVCMYVRQ